MNFVNIQNLKHWYSATQTMELTGFNYTMQLVRWRKQNNITFTKLCGRTFYYRALVNSWLMNRTEMFNHRAVTIGGQTQVMRNRSYVKTVELKHELLGKVAYDIDLEFWRPYCLLENDPHTTYLWRLVKKQHILPQIRTKRAYDMIFYNVQDIKQEFKNRSKDDN